MSIEADIGREVADLAGQRPVIVLKSSEFRRTREQSWQELERLVDAAERRGMRMLAPHELNTSSTSSCPAVARRRARGWRESA